MEKEIYDQYIAQMNLEQERGDNQMKMYAPQLQEQIKLNQAVVITETDPEKDFKKLLLKLRGFEEKNGEAVKVRESLLNDKGIDKIANMLSIIVTNSIRLGRLNETQVRKFTQQIMDSFSVDLGLYWREYGIKERTTYDLIIDHLLVFVYSLLSRSEDQNEKNFLGRVSFETLGRQPVQKEGKSWLEKFKL